MKTQTILLLLAIAQPLFAQSQESHLGSDNHKNEIGIANSLIYILEEKEFTYGLHAHFTRSFKESKFGIGVGFERIYDDHKHNTIGVLLSYTPAENLALSISPGITWRDNNPSNLHFGLHFETLYEFEIGIFHVGPVAEIAYSEDDYHVSLGMHLGFGF